MKKFLTIAFICSTLPVFAFDALPTIPLNEVSPMSDMQAMEAQRFRQEQINYYSDVETEKKRFEKANQKVTNQQDQPIIQKMINNTSSEFVEENGKIKIKYLH